MFCPTQNRNGDEIRMRTNQMMTTAFVGCMICICPGSLWSQHLPLSVEDALKTHSLVETSPLALSPDGQWLAYAVRDNQRSRVAGDHHDVYIRSGIPSRNCDADIWIVNLQDMQQRSLTGGIGSNWMPTWSPDGRHLAFLSDRDGSGQAKLWVWELGERAPRKLSDAMVRADTLKWTVDSKEVLVTVIPTGTSLETYVARVSTSMGTGTVDGVKPTAGVTANIYVGKNKKMEGRHEDWGPALNLDAIYLRDLVSVELRSGTVKVQIHGDRVGWYAPSPDGSQIAYTIPKRFLRPGFYQTVADVAVVERATFTPRVLVVDVLLDGAVSWSPKRPLLAYRAFQPDEKSYDYYVLDTVSEQVAAVSSLAPHRTDGLMRIAMWDPSGERLYFLVDGELWRASYPEGQAVCVSSIPGHHIEYRISTDEGVLWTSEEGSSTIVIARDDQSEHEGFFKINLATGESLKVLENRQCYSCSQLGTDQGSYIAAAAKDKIIYVAEDAGQAPDVWAVNANFKNPRRVTNLNPQFNRYKMGKSRLIHWLSDDGEPLEGALLLPSDYQEGNRYPMVVWAYSGSRLSEHVDEFALGQYPGPLNMQLLATRGYAVFLPDSQRVKGSPMLGLAKAVLPGVNKVIELGIADPNRLAIMGHSGAAYSALAIIAQTNRFKAAVAISGFSDFSGFYGFMLKDGTFVGYRETLKFLSGPPWQHLKDYIENSPFFYLDTLETPLLVIHGSKDTAVTPFLSDEVFVSLSTLGKPVEYVRYEGEDHAPGGWGYENQADLSNRVLAWLGKYLAQ